MERPGPTLRTRKWFAVLTVSCFLFSGYNLMRHGWDQEWLKEKAQAIVQEAGAASRPDQVRALRDYLRRHIRHEGVRLDARPFLRATAREVLETDQGYCGDITRAFINLARNLGIRAQRVNLYGRLNHVIAETEIAPGKWILVDPQNNPEANPFLDRREWTLDAMIADPEAPFLDYSNINLSRLPLVRSWLRRIKLQAGEVTWVMENPFLLKAYFFLFVGIGGIAVWVLDQALLRAYTRRLRSRVAIVVRARVAVPDAALAKG